MVLLDAAIARHAVIVVDISVDVVTFRVQFYYFSLICMNFSQILTGVTV